MAKVSMRTKEESAYAGVKQVLEAGDEAARARLAARADSAPEVLYYLAGDEAAAVRSAVAGNAATPAQADLTLSGDPDERVRLSLARKLADLLAHRAVVPAPDQARLFNETLGALTRDRSVAVRQVIAEAAAAHRGVPPDLVQRLAEDEDAAVALPILRDSPDLSPAQLAQLVERYAEAQRQADDTYSEDGRPNDGRLTAVAGRDALTIDVVARLVETEDDEVIGTVLENGGAEMADETLEELAEKAESKPAWHAPLVSRPRLTQKAVLSLVRYIAGELLERLRGRGDLDPETLSAVEQAIESRLDRPVAGGPATARAAAAPPGTQDEDGQAMAKAAELLARGRLDSEELSEALMRGDERLVAAGLALLSDYNMAFVRHVRDAKSAKGVVALAWKAGVTPRFAGQLQATWAHIPRHQVLKTSDGVFPLGKDEMLWQLEFLEGLRE